MTHISGYIQAAIFALIFMLFINGEIGSVLLYVLVGANIVSIAVLLLSKKHFAATLQRLSGTVENGKNVEFEVTLKKNGFCFIPFVEICIEAENPIHLRTSLLFRKSVTVTGQFRASHSGLNTIRMERVFISDFMGDLRLPVLTEQSAQMAVLPKIIEYDGPEVPPNMLPSDEEETEEGVSVRQGGMPGYEHREYAPGDSPRRVNYKLSAKKGKLMVRMDESNGSASTNLYISENALPVCCDKAFALASKLVIHGGTVKITHKNDSRTASTPETLDRMREWLAFREFAEDVLPETGSPPEDTAVVFSGDGNITAVPAH